MRYTETELDCITKGQHSIMDEDIKVSNTVVKVSTRSGTVEKVESNNATSVYGGDQGGQVVVSSTTTSIQDLILKDENTGTEFDIKFKKFEVPCRVGHRLSILSLKRSDGAEYPSYIFNHATQKEYVNQTGIIDALHSKLPYAGLYLLGFLLVGCLIGFLWMGAIGAVVGGIFGFLAASQFDRVIVNRFRKKKLSALNNHPTMEQYVKSLRN